MADVSPGSAITIFAGLLLGGVKIAGEILKARNEKRLKDAYADSAPPPTPAPVEPPASIALESARIELLRARFEVEELTQACRRMRQALDDGAKEQAKLSAALTEERAHNEALVREVKRLITQGGDTDAVDRGERRAVVDPERGRFFGAPDDRPRVRPEGRPGPRKGR